MKSAKIIHKLCKRCGLTERYASTGTCVACHKVASKKYVAENPEKRKASNKKYNDKNLEKVRAGKKKWRVENPEKMSACQKKWREENFPLRRYYVAKYRADKRKQTPPWAALEVIKEIYRNCPDGKEVDHIHPISKGGLHVDYNLQYLSKHDNRVKNNNIL